MNVFIVITEYCVEELEFKRIEGVFSTEYLALKFIKIMKEDDNIIETYVSVWELDEVEYIRKDFHDQRC